MGSKRKRMRFQDEIEWMDRRRSSRIIALEEKKHKEREKKLSLALERKNNLVNNHDKEKGKATMEVPNDFSDFNEDEEKKGHKSKEFYQLISSIKEFRRHYENERTLGRNDSSLSGTSLKNILRIITDFLQREDPDELFAQPTNLDVVENYFEVVKQPMDFGTIRAKIHEGLYTNFQQFKRDVFLMLSNAMNTNQAFSKYHSVAEDISRFAKHVFEALADPQYFDSELFLDKKRHRKPQQGQVGTSQRVSPKATGRKNVTHVEVPKTEKRHMYWPPSKPLVAEVLCAENPKIQLNTNSIKYKESLLRFVEDLGPTARRVAAKKLEALRDQQQCNSETPSPQTQPAALNAQTLALALPFLNRSLTIPGSASQGNKFFNNRGESSSGIESSSNLFPRVSPTRVISGTSGINLPMSSSLVSQSRPQNSISCMPSNSLTSSINPPMSSSSLESQSMPQSVISCMPSNNLRSSINLPASLSLESQSMPESFISCMSSNNITQFSVAREPRPNDFVDLSDLFKPRPRNSIYGMASNNSTEPSLVNHPWQADSVYGPDPSSVSHPSQPIQGISTSSTTPYQSLLDSQASFINNNTLKGSEEQVLHQAPFTPFDNMQMQNHSSYFQLNETDGWKLHI